MEAAEDAFFQVDAEGAAAGVAAVDGARSFALRPMATQSCRQAELIEDAATAGLAGKASMRIEDCSFAAANDGRRKKTGYFALPRQGRIHFENTAARWPTHSGVRFAVQSNTNLCRMPRAQPALEHCVLRSGARGIDSLTFGIGEYRAMGWASGHIEKLRSGKTVSFRPRGHSMSGKIESGQLCTVTPVNAEGLKVGDIVLCKVNGREYLHLVKAIQGARFQIGNNRGRINGWVSANSIFGRLSLVEA